ncbi:hypothetical protein LFL97_23690 [Burkholderia sp. JSH-S8]|nr:hypothetical protein LFL97_23690 [Burkholderia sp. JSH-S8]
MLDILKAVAPWLVTALTAGVPGVAVMEASTIAEKLGLSDKSVDAVNAALGGQPMTPEQLLALKQADADFELKMRQAGFTHAENMAGIQVWLKQTVPKTFTGTHTLRGTSGSNIVSFTLLAHYINISRMLLEHSRHAVLRRSVAITVLMKRYVVNVYVIYVCEIFRKIEARNSMNSKAVVAAIMLLVGALSVVHAAPSIDFVNQEGSSITYRSVQCVAKHSEGQVISVQGQQGDRISSVNLKNLLAGAEGKYGIQCAAVHAQSGVRYATEFEAVKFRAGEFGSRAPEYDENRFGYGVRIPSSKKTAACYDRVALVLREPCLSDYYGREQYHSSQVSGIEDVEFRYDGYSSDVGVFLERNPRVSWR